MFFDFELFWLVISRTIEVGKNFIPQKRPFERSFETGGISIMRGPKWFLVKVIHIQLRGHGHPENDASPNSFSDYKSSTLGLSNEVLFVPNSFETYWKLTKCLFFSLGIEFHLHTTVGKKIWINKTSYLVCPLIAV